MKKYGYVYLLMESTDEELYKIGVTRGTIENRIRSLQTGNGSEISLCRYYKTKHPFLIEKKLHEHHMSQRTSGEWYKLDADDVLNFEKECESLEKMIDSLKDNPFVSKKIDI